MVRTTSTSASSQFFDELQFWSETKLRVLTKYLDAYLRKRNKNPVIYYVDGFAGAGKYDEGGPNEAEGSPLRVARLAQDIANSSKPYRLVCINVEADPERYAALYRHLASFDPAIVRVLQGDFLQHLDSILRTIGDAPAIFFLDPFGVREVTPLRIMQRIFNRPDTEIFLNFNSFRLNMLAGSDDSHAPEAAGKVRLVNEVFGEDPNATNPEWLTEWRRLQGAPGAGWRQWAADRYKDLLVERSRHLEHAIAYPVREDYNGIPKYHLIFASRSPHPIPILNDLLCTEEDSLFDNVHIAGQMDMFAGSDFERVRVRLATLADDLHLYGRSRPHCTRNDIYVEYAIAHPLRYKMKHHRRALDELVQAGRARYNGPKDDKTPIEFFGT